jgi:N-acetylmuramoyl-L-alanine amidase
MRKAILSCVAVAAIAGSFGEKAAAQEMTVKKGDTLWSISKAYKVSVEQVKDWNHISSDTIQPDQKLKVSPEAPPYIVKKGDTLWKIAKEKGVSVHNLKEWNHLESDMIFPEQEIAFSSLDGSKASLDRQKESLGKTITVKATGYTAYCEGCSGVTKTGINLRENPGEKVIAVDPNVIPLGSKVYVEGYGYATAGDIGGGIEGKEIDIFFPEEHNAINWGVKTVKVSIIN